MSPWNSQTLFYMYMHGTSYSTGNERVANVANVLAVNTHYIYNGTCANDLPLHYGHFSRSRISPYKRI